MNTGNIYFRHYLLENQKISFRDFKLWGGFSKHLCLKRALVKCVFYFSYFMTCFISGDGTNCLCFLPKLKLFSDSIQMTASLKELIYQTYRHYLN